MIIGLSGYARSGKNTVADILGPDYRQLSFAEPMREAMLKLNPLVEGRIRLAELVDEEGWQVAKTYPEVRRLLQVFGTEVGRNMFGEDFWVDLAMYDVSPHEDVVFTDVRFPNEAEAIREMGGIIWRVDRKGIEAVNAHPSETALDDWNFDRVIDNNGTLDELREMVVG